MFRYRSFLLVVVIAAQARAEPLTFEQALRIATHSSPDIAQQEASAEGARAASIAAGRFPDPKLTFGVENVPATGADQWSLTRDFMTMRKVGLMQDIPNNAKREAQKAVAQGNIAWKEAERRVSILSVRRDTAVAWLSRYYLERRSRLFDDLDHENQLFARAVQAALSAGRGMPADVLGPKQEAAEIADERDDLAAEIARSKAALKRWVGMAAEEPLGGEPPELTLDVAQLREHVHEHPDLAVFVPMTQVAQAEVHEAEASRRPDWGVDLSFARRGSGFSDMVSLQFTLDLPLFTRTRQDPRITVKREELARVENQRAAMLRDHTQELEDELAEYEVLSRQLRRLREVHLRLAQEKVDEQFASYRAGKADLTSVLQARRELIGQRMREIELQARQAVVVAKLFYFYGPGTAETVDTTACAQEAPR